MPFPLPSLPFLLFFLPFLFSSLPFPSFHPCPHSFLLCFGRVVKLGHEGASGPLCDSNWKHSLLICSGNGSANISFRSRSPGLLLVWLLSKYSLPVSGAF
jgi:hypothetical protein